MTEIHADKDEAFKAIKDSIPPEFDDPTEEQQEGIDKLDRQTGFNPKPKKRKKDKDDKMDELPKYYIQKFSNDEMLIESILIAGVPKFLVARKDVVTIEDQSVFPDKILKPLEFLSYINKPYSFGSAKEVKSYIKKEAPDTLDSLYRKVKSIWKKYVDADDFHISICAADTIFSYFQDKIGLTHYLFFVGNPASGKSNNLTVFQHLAYRNMTSSDMSHSNIYQFLGSMDEGVGTLCEDEADNIDDYPDKMRIYKNGYTTGRPILKTDTTYGRKQYKFNTFCFKAFAAERLPDSVKAKGFNQRIIEIPCVYGFPIHDISEVINPAGESEHILLLNELMEIRNALLIYRLKHYGDKLPDIKTNLHNREKQLFKPVLRIFHNTSALNEILPVISKYVSQKREANANTLYAFLYRVIKHLMDTKGLEIPSKTIWEKITTPYLIESDSDGKPQLDKNGQIVMSENPYGLAGEFIPNKKLSYDTEEFGVISQKQISEICKDVFGATKSKRHGTSNKLVFDPKKIERLGKVYDIDLEVKVKENGEDGDDGIDVGLDRHLKAQTGNTNSTIVQEERCENYNNDEEIIPEITLKKDTNEPSDPNNPPHLSHLPQTD